jgi:hypothetical protein
MKLTKSKLKQIIKEELQKVLNEEENYLEGIVQSWIKEGYRRVKALPRLPNAAQPGLRGMEPGASTVAVWGPGPNISFRDFPQIKLVSTVANKGQTTVQWDFEEKEFENIIGAKINGAGTVHAALYKI